MHHAQRPSLADVLQCYRLLLGRPPEDEAVLHAHVQNAPDIDTLRRAFLLSDEFRDQLHEMGVMIKPVPVDAAPIQVETDCDPATLRHLLDRTGAFWTDIGSNAPHFSVLTEPEFLPDRLPGNLASFDAAGALDLAALLATLRRCGQDPARFRHVVELGCGVGRVTRHLARAFPRVTAIDISASHLAVAQQELAAAGLGGVTLRQATPDDPMPAEHYDLWFTRLVLQHNPPPVMAHLLERALRRLLPGGVAYFQLPTYRLGYAFNLRDYLASPLGREMEMHVLPQDVVFRIVAAEGCRVLELREEPHACVRGPTVMGRFLVGKG